MQIVKATVLAALICASAATGLQAGGLAEPIAEVPPAQPEEPFVAPQGSVNGGYLLLGAFVVMAALTASGN